MPHHLAVSSERKRPPRSAGGGLGEAAGGGLGELTIRPPQSAQSCPRAQRCRGTIDAAASLSRRPGGDGGKANVACSPSSQMPLWSW